MAQPTTYAMMGNPSAYVHPAIARHVAKGMHTFHASSLAAKLCIVFALLIAGLVAVMIFFSAIQSVFDSIFGFGSGESTVHFKHPPLTGISKYLSEHPGAWKAAGCAIHRAKPEFSGLNVFHCSPSISYMTIAPSYAVGDDILKRVSVCLRLAIEGTLLTKNDLLYPECCCKEELDSSDTCAHHVNIAKTCAVHCGNSRLFDEEKDDNKQLFYTFQTIYNNQGLTPQPISFSHRVPGSNYHNATFLDDMQYTHTCLGVDKTTCRIVVAAADETTLKGSSVDSGKAITPYNPTDVVVCVRTLVPDGHHVMDIVNEANEPPFVQLPSTQYWEANFKVAVLTAYHSDVKFSTFTNIANAATCCSDTTIFMCLSYQKIGCDAVLNGTDYDNRVVQICQPYWDGTITCS